MVAVLSVVLRDEKVLIVQRAQQPNAGRWGFPGGVLELGETVAEGAMRELLEETGIVAEAAGTLNVNDAVSRDDEAGHVQFHYVLIAVRGIWKSGDGLPAMMPRMSPGPAATTSSPANTRPFRRCCRSSTSRSPPRANSA